MRGRPRTPSRFPGVLLEVERPELIVPDLLQRAVGVLAVRRQREADAAGRPERVEVEILGVEVHAADAHHRAVLHRILRLVKIPVKKPGSSLVSSRGAEIERGRMPSSIGCDSSQLSTCLKFGGVEDQDVCRRRSRAACRRAKTVGWRFRAPRRPATGWCAIICAALRSYCMQLGGPISQRSISFVAVLVIMIMKRFERIGSNQARMRDLACCPRSA